MPANLENSAVATGLEKVSLHSNLKERQCQRMFILTVASRLLHPHHTDEKTSRLTEKRFSTVRDTQRDSQSYMEKRRGRRETGDQEEKRRNQKGQEQSSQ